jgi:DNA-binding transcriptional ArsR family regulator
MAYNELIKNFDGIRDYMREFYLYGFKNRYEYDKKSTRSYDDVRRRLESWLGDYMGFRQTADGKNAFISIDSRISRHNPLYKAWRARSFTDGDITLHFLLFDILHSSEVVLSLNEITDIIDERLAVFNQPKMFDSSTVRKKLKEYEGLGLIVTEKRGKLVYYRRAEDIRLNCTDMLDFYSEVAPCGVIGSFLLDRAKPHTELFAFKHHYITQALDSDILCTVFEAINQRCKITVETINASTRSIVPLRVYVSVQNGRQYLMGYMTDTKKINGIRLDKIALVDMDEACENWDELCNTLNTMQAHIWGVSTHGNYAQLERVEFTIKYNDGEEYIPNRLEREKRCGTVERLDEHTSRFTAEVYDCNELVPWIRTFICRITELSFSDKSVEEQFKADMAAMYEMYGVGNGE